MAVYRITRFAASDMNKVKELTENMRDVLEGLDADFITNLNSVHLVETAAANNTDGSLCGHRAPFWHPGYEKSNQERTF